MRAVPYSNVLVSSYLEDRADSAIVATAVSGDAPYIVSGDDDLHRLGIYQGVRVVAPALFVELLSQ